nr:hypothetical protein LTR18_007153 [Exophiala xenobiotica]
MPIGENDFSKFVLDLVGVNATVQPTQTLPRVLEPILSHREPGRLRQEQCPHEDYRRPDPLSTEGYTIGPVRMTGDKGPQNSGGEDFPDGPSQIDPSGQVRTQHQRADLGGVDRGQRKENNQREAEKHLSGHQHADAGAEELHEDEAGRDDTGDQGRLFETKFVGRPPSDEQAEKLSNLDALSHGTQTNKTLDSDA